MEPRDYVDTAAALGRYTVARLIGLARRLDPGLTERDFADASVKNWPQSGPGSCIVSLTDKTPPGQRDAAAALLLSTKSPANGITALEGGSYGALDGRVLAPAGEPRAAASRLADLLGLIRT